MLEGPNLDKIIRYGSDTVTPYVHIKEKVIVKNKAGATFTPLRVNDWR